MSFIDPYLLRGLALMYEPPTFWDALLRGLQPLDNKKSGYKAFALLAGVWLFVALFL